MAGWLETKKMSDGRTAYLLRWREGGKKRKEYIGPVSRRDAERALQVKGRDLMLAPFGLQQRERVTLKSFIEGRWLPRRSVRPNTERRDLGVLRTYIYPALGGTELDRITVEDVDKLMARVTRESSAYTAKRTLAVLRRALNDARRYGLLGDNPASLATVETPRRPLRLLSLEQVAAAVAAVPRKHRDLVVFAALTGMRWGEQAALTWGDVELDPPMATVNKQAPANLCGAISEPKSVAGNRVVDLQPLVREVLFDRAARELPEVPKAEQLVFPGERGGVVNYRWFMRHVWQPALRAAGLPGIKWHDLRHFYASLLIAFGHDYLYVSRQLGHSSPTVTLNVYAHAFEEQKRGKKLDRDGALSKLTAAFRGESLVKVTA